MDLISNLALGFETALTFQNLLYAFIGCLLGTLIGILPGLGPLATISMLLPITYGLDPTAALIMLAGIYYGAAYGGSTTAILVNLPGETSSVITVIDGHQMARNGRAGVAIATAGIGSFVAGCFGTLVLAAFATPLSTLAYTFSPADYFSLMLLGLIGAVSLSKGNLVRAIGMIFLGVILGCVGTDINTGYQRLTFGQPNLWEGLDFIVIAVGIFAIAEVITSLKSESDEGSTVTKKVGQLMPSKDDFKRMTPSIIRGTGIGTLLGILPGAGPAIASFLSYSFEKKVSKYGHEMGNGAIEGVAAPEAANNAAAQTAFIPTLSLGIPGTPTMALILGAMIMHNVQPGPQVMVSNPSLFWGVIASMWIGNAVLLILNLPFVGLWVKLLHIPYRLLFPGILLFCAIGVFGTQFSIFDLFLMVGFGIVGYIFKLLECEPAPLVMGFVLGPLIEENFRRATVLSQGDMVVFITSPISACFLGLAVMMLLLVAIPSFGKNRDIICADDT